MYYMGSRIQIPSWEAAILKGERSPIAKYRESAVSCAKSIELLFRLWSRVGPRKHVIGGVQTDATWRLPLNYPCAAVMRPVVKLL